MPLIPGNDPIDAGGNVDMRLKTSAGDMYYPYLMDYYSIPFDQIKAVTPELLESLGLLVHDRPVAIEEAKQTLFALLKPQELDREETDNLITFLQTVIRLLTNQPCEETLLMVFVDPCDRDSIQYVLPTAQQLDPEQIFEGGNWFLVPVDYHY